MDMFHLKNKLINGQIVITGWCSLGSSLTAEIMGNVGFDCVNIDLQHGLASEEIAFQCLQAVTSTPAIPMARSRWNEPANIMRLLDFGAMGIICPMINTKEDAKKFVSACRYGPRGERSFGPIRSSICYGTDYYKNANDAIVTIAMIETQKGLENLENILQVEELDGIFIGPNDLGISLGEGPVLDQENLVLDKTLQFILKSCKKYRKVPGIFCGTVKGCLRRIEQGFTHIALGNDVLLFKQIANSSFNELKKNL